ncbi:cache domain-containing protein [Loktanella sp. SALINAS62]|uniref:cache domain-containing protein n=1 Tax=Loktanella sp. SALINAS62 TaxID=2706124 RepID=UPI001B8C3B7D|nr:cache domain-containing protein [Loktanella sp. SALINAS62]MBS1302687.1 hypothetical protein [Loktanella sp. SALINAS62]
MPNLTLRQSVLVFTLLCAGCAGAFLSAVVHLQSQRLTESNLDYTVRFRTAAAAEDLARTLEGEWRDLVYLSERVTALEPATLTQLLTGAGGDGGRVSWIGFADLNGSVVAANNGLLVGQNVSERPWYRNGLTGGYAGDVHDAVLLAQLLDSGSDEPIRFIDLARPVTDANGDLAGVLGVHINENWLESYLRETADLFGLELYLVNQNGEVSASSSGEEPVAGDLQILRAAQTGVQSRGQEIWPDGQEYFASLVPQVTYGDLPNFGWRMIGRLDPATLDFRAGLVRSGALYAILAGIIFALGVAVVYSQIFMTPFARLAISAQRIADGSLEYPANSRITREAAQLSEALTRLQQDRVSDDR